MTAAKAEMPATLPAPAACDLDDAPELIIKPRKGWIAIDWSELVRYRELLYFLIWRDVKVRYKQAVLGVAWAVLQPVFAMLVFTMFGKLGGFKDQIPSTIPFQVWVYAGLLPWMFFAASIGMGGMSLVSQQHLLTKIYFPRMFMPTATIGGALFDMCISSCVFVILMAIHGVMPTWQIVFLPLLMILQVMAGLGIAYTLSALTVSYRDFRFIIPFMVQILLFLSFVFIPLYQLKDGAWTPSVPIWLASLNPLSGIIEGYRSAIFPEIPWRPMNLAISAVMTTAIFIFGLFYFRKTERRFADIA